MKRYVARRSAVLASVAAGVLVAGLAATQANADPTAVNGKSEPSTVSREDNFPHALSEKQDALRKEAISKLIKGEVNPVSRNGSEVIRLAGNRWVEWKKKPKKDPILTFLVEFGDQTLPATGGDAGPVHNQIPEPDRVYNGDPTDDNTTIWRADFNRQSYLDLFFSQSKQSMYDFYLKQSSGRYTVTGDVSDWVTVPYNESRYGSNNISESNGYWNFIKDSATAWYNAQVAAGKSQAEITSYLQQFDIWDRYDHDGDGNFNEPDGYIDHFQAVHAGMGEEVGGGAQGEDAIWSHRWYAFVNQAGVTGPPTNPLGGVPIGDSGIWIGDYTTEPENGGIGVFSHEYGHDLGLPDMYDTQGGDNGTGFWTIMSAGSYLNDGTVDLGTKPGYMGAWEKLFLGWLDYRTVNFGQDKNVLLGPAGDTSGILPQAVVVNLPDQTVTNTYISPYSGGYEWWGGSDDDLNNSMTRTIDLSGVTSASLSAKIWYDIEEDYDTLNAEASTDGTSWTALSDTAGADPDDGAADGVEPAIDGTSDGWVDLNYDLSPYAGQQVQFRFRYNTDGGLHYDGAFLDDITITTDGAAVQDDEGADTSGWSTNGFVRFTGTTTEVVPQFYVAENRQYVGYDEALRTGPYNFNAAASMPDYAERFPYQAGLLVWYVNYAYGDNNTIVHPGAGLALPVDARPANIVYPSGVQLANRRQPYDATFGLHKTSAVTFHRERSVGVFEQVTVPASPAISTFDDSDPNAYFDSTNPWASVKVAGAGVKIKVVVDLRGPIKVMLVNVTS